MTPASATFCWPNVRVHSAARAARCVGRWGHDPRARNPAGHADGAGGGTLKTVINGQNAALEAPAFREKLRRAREFLLSDVVRNYGARPVAASGDPHGQRGRLGTFSRTKSAIMAIARGGLPTFASEPVDGGKSSTPMTGSKSSELYRRSDDGASAGGKPPLVPLNVLAFDTAASGSSSRPASATSAPIEAEDVFVPGTRLRRSEDNGMWRGGGGTRRSRHSSSLVAETCVARVAVPNVGRVGGSMGSSMPGRSLSFRGLRSLHRRSTTDMGSAASTPNVLAALTEDP